MTQDTDKCPNRQLYTDISAWITDAKILSVFARTGHHGQYEGHKGRFGSLWRHLSSQQPVCSSNVQLTPMMGVGNVGIQPTSDSFDIRR